MANDRKAFETAMVAAGYDKPERATRPDSGYLYQRDEDRFVGWSLASHTGEAEPRVTPAMVEHQQQVAADAESIGKNLDAIRGQLAATPAAPGEVTAALKQWAWHWFGPDADEEWIAKALANLPQVIQPLEGVDQRGLEVAASFVQLHAPDSPLYDHLRSIAARIRPAALSHPAPVAAPTDEAIEDFLAARMTNEGRVPMLKTIREALTHFAAPEPASEAAKLDYVTRSLRAIADRGRAELGDSYPEIVSLWAIVRDLHRGDSADAPVQQAGLPDLPKAFEVVVPPNSEPYGLFTAKQMIEYRLAPPKP